MMMKSFDSICPDHLQTPILFEVRRPDSKKTAIFRIFELYCPDPTCDCQKVSCAFVKIDQAMEVHAVVAFGWGSIAFYQSWAGFSKREAQNMREGYLELLAPRGSYASAILQAFQHQARTDKTFVGLLKNHYTMFKAKMREEEQAPKADNVMPLRRRS